MDAQCHALSNAIPARDVLSLSGFSRAFGHIGQTFSMMFEASGCVVACYDYAVNPPLSRRIAPMGPEGLGVVRGDEPTTSVGVQFDPVVLIAEDEPYGPLTTHTPDDEGYVDEGQR